MNIYKVFRIWIRNLFEQLCSYYDLSHGADNTRIRFSRLEIEKIIIFWRQVKCCSIEYTINFSERIGLVSCKILVLIMQLSNYIHISIKSICFYLKHQIALGFTYKCLFSLNFIFAIPLIRWIGNVPLPDCCFFD